MIGLFTRIHYIGIISLLFISINAYSHKADSLQVHRAEFIENKGQWDSQIKYTQQLPNSVMFLEKDRLTFDLTHPTDAASLHGYKDKKEHAQSKSDHMRKHAYQMVFVDALPSVDISGKLVHSSYHNYMLGNDKSKWVSRVRKFEQVHYTELYKNIDFLIYSQDGFLKYDFILNPGSEPNDIQISYEGVDKLKIKDYNLHILTSVNEIIELKPYAYQIDDNGQKVIVPCQFKQNGNSVSFELGRYDRNKPLTIDPVLVFSSYSGSSSNNWGFTATYDSHGFLYGGGITAGTGYPTTLGAYDTSFNGGDWDISISKFDSSGTFLKYSTYIGGSDVETPSSLVVNSNDELYILSVTSSDNFPVTTQAYDTTFDGGTGDTTNSGIIYNNGTDIVISRLSVDGTQLLSSTFFGGSANDGLNVSADLQRNYGDAIRGEIVFDNNDNCYIVSSTLSDGLASSKSFQPTRRGNQEGIIAKFNYQLSNLSWASYIGGTDDDGVYSIAIDKYQDIFITGGTNSNNILTTLNTLFQTYQGGSADGFIAHINKNGTQLLHCTYIGSSVYDQSFFVDVDRNNNVYVFGQTLDISNVFIFNAAWNMPGKNQFISKLSTDLSSYIWSTQFGGTEGTGISLAPSAFMVDLCNRVYLSAWGGTINGSSSTTSGLPITSNAFQSTTDGDDYYFLVLMDDASQLSYATFFGGTQSGEHVDGGTSRFDNHGRIYQAVCAGCWGNDDFPTTSSCHSSTNGSASCNLAVIKFNFNLPVVVADYVKPPVNCAPVNIAFNNTSKYISGSTTSSCFWDFGDGTTSTSCSPSHLYTTSGIYPVTLIIKDTNSCNVADTIVRNVVVLSGKRDTIAKHNFCIGDVGQIGLPPVNDTNVSYHWTPSSYLSNVNISNPITSAPATMYYTLFISNGVCTDTLVQQVKVVDIQFNLPSDTTICHNQITLIPHCTELASYYHWSSNVHFTDTLNQIHVDSSIIVSNITVPTYFYVRAFLGTCYGMDSILVSKEVYVSNVATEPLCNNDTNGHIQITPQHGQSPFHYNWNTGSISNPIQQLGANTYSVTITDDNGCFTVEQITLGEPAVLESKTSQRNIPCQNACIGKAFANPLGGTPPYQWQWNDSQSQTVNPAIDLCEGTFYVTVTDAHSCIILDTVNVIDSSQFMTFDAWISGGITKIYEGQDILLNSKQFGSGYHYSWTPTTGLSNPYSAVTIASPLVTTMYIVRVEDNFGCFWLDSVWIEVSDVICDEPHIFVPNSFTPNGNGKNEILYVRSNVIYDMEFRIYDRLGELVFVSKDPQQGWDGTYRGKALEPDVFIYHLIITCYNKEIYNKKGNITLIR